MIECKPYKITFSTDTTCVANQHKLLEFKKKKRPTYGSGAYMEIMAKQPPEYFRIRACDGCKIGQKLYAKAKAENRLPVEHHKQWTNGNPSEMAIIAYRAQNACVGW